MSVTYPSETWLLNRYITCDDRAAREQLVRSMMPLVRRIAHAYGTRGRAEDLEQVAALGLVKAIGRYDPARGVSLRTYAIPTMLGEVRRHLRDHGWAVRLPRALQERVLSVTKAADRLTARLGRSPTVDEIAAEVDCATEDVLEALLGGEAFLSLSLDAPADAVDDGRAPLGETLACEDPRLELADAIVTFGDACGRLDPAEHRLLYMRFIEDLTQTEIAGCLGVSQMQVSRLLRRVVDRLQERGAAFAA